MCQMPKKFSVCDHATINSNTYTNRNVQSQMQKLKLFFIHLSLSLSLRKLYSLSWQIKYGGVVLWIFGGMGRLLVCWWRSMLVCCWSLVWWRWIQSWRWWVCFGCGIGCGSWVFFVVDCWFCLVLEWVLRVVIVNGGFVLVLGWIWCPCLWVLMVLVMVGCGFEVVMGCGDGGLRWSLKFFFFLVVASFHR